MFRIGLVGAGGMGTVHYSNYAHIDDCKVVAIVGQSDQDRQKAQDWGLPLYADIDTMLDQTEIDLVDICTPTFLHKGHVISALQRGKHVIVEKPMALTAADARELYRTAKQHNVQIYVGQVLRFYPESKVLMGLKESQEYGKPLDATFERLSACPRWAQGGWLFDRSKSGHIPFDLHIHDLDLMISLFGIPEEFSFTSCGNAEKGYQEQYRFFYRFSQLHAIGEAAWFNADIPFTARWRVYFERAVVINDGTQVIAYQFDQEPRVFDTTEKIKIPTGINVPPTGVFLEELTHYTQCAQAGLPSDRVKEHEVIAVLEILEQISDQNEEGGNHASSRV